MLSLITIFTGLPFTINHFITIKHFQRKRFSLIAFICDGKIYFFCILRTTTANHFFIIRYIQWRQYLIT
ncbi:Uncharacterised protein [Klebsiella pneumoniae]|nr:Uncharacterised protein [Klebsiella pneumoniae]